MLDGAPVGADVELFEGTAVGLLLDDDTAGLLEGAANGLVEEAAVGG